jgi:hypothetical protein
MFEHETSQDGLVTVFAFDDTNVRGRCERLSAEELHVAGGEP